MPIIQIYTNNDSFSEEQKKEMINGIYKVFEETWKKPKEHANIMMIKTEFTVLGGTEDHCAFIKIMNGGEIPVEVCDQICEVCVAQKLCEKPRLMIHRNVVKMTDMSFYFPMPEKKED